MNKNMEILGVLDADREAVGFMTPTAMKGLLFISNFEKEDPDSPAPDGHGYQREPIKDRIPKIARFYLDSGHMARTTPLTLSIRLADSKQISHFIELFNAEDKHAIREAFGDSCISVVDGQHRYLGLVKANEMDENYNPKVPVLVNFGLTFAEEAQFFDVINSTQRKLPKALIEITKADVIDAGEMTHAQRIRLITTMLARHADSVWLDQINFTGARDPKRPVTFEGARRSTASMFSKEILERIDARDLNAERIARDFWRLVAEACPDAWNNEPRKITNDDGEVVEADVAYRLKELVGVASLARLGQNVIASALEHDSFDQRFAQLIGKLAAVDWAKIPGNPWMRSQAGFAGQSELYSVLYSWVYSGKHPE
ncbi:DGQHR domain-containing protein [Arthrobacter sp. zg-Y1116]|uniref:DGQHR domain-containing protein n=1 Tax=Arthrobacter sp. zg-Y1116 TaxID=2964611 RepID=UPI002102B09F|nr:DGQHR domain-containing protein [Arthrobacter sp. zg-Y1116]MCQ1947576.1 DGQHR domain-containing protein [Arthrobacter sp. zg-Y1116]